MARGIVKKSNLILHDLVGTRAEVLLAVSELEGNPKRLTAKVIIDKDGGTKVLFTVYDSNNTPITATPNLSDAVNKYTALEARSMESVGSEGIV